MSFAIKEIYVEYQKAPIGLDEKRPRFSWFFSSEEKNMRQSACRILVKKVTPAAQEKIVWDSGKLETGESRGVEYDGEELEACTVYSVSVQAWDAGGNSACEDTCFETGMLNFSAEEEDINHAWEGAQWIAAPRFHVCAQARGVFILETELRLEPGSRRAGVVFGANDFRLLDKNQNEYGLEGENYIRYEINLQALAGKPAQGQAAGNAMPTLDIYRAGYAPGDREDIPFASVPLVPFEREDSSQESTAAQGTGEAEAGDSSLITEENAYDFHCLRIEVDGNNAFTYLDGVLVDAVAKQEFFGRTVKGRTLNPRGNNDVLTYPRLTRSAFLQGRGTAPVSNICQSGICARLPRNSYGKRRRAACTAGKESFVKKKGSVLPKRNREKAVFLSAQPRLRQILPIHPSPCFVRSSVHGRTENQYRPGCISLPGEFMNAA